MYSLFGFRFRIEIHIRSEIFKFSIENIYRTKFYALGGSKVNGQIIKEMHGRIVKNFMDLLIMAELKDSPMSGYDVISFIHKKFRLLVSSGTVYSLLYSLERDGFIEGKFSNRKRVYALTVKGEETIQTIQEASEQIQTFISNIFKRFNNAKTSREELDTVVYSD